MMIPSMSFIVPPVLHFFPVTDFFVRYFSHSHSASSANSSRKAVGSITVTWSRHDATQALTSCDTSTQITSGGAFWYANFSYE